MNRHKRDGSRESKSKCPLSLHYAYTEEPSNKASANTENPPTITWILIPQILFLLIVSIGNKASLVIRDEINWSIEMPQRRVRRYMTKTSLFIPPYVRRLKSNFRISNVDIQFS